MPPRGRAAPDIHAAIDAAGGAIPWSAFMDLALYGPHGFYTAADAVGTAGRRGDFITSPEVGPLFGAVIARYLDAVWERLDRPDPFTVVDAGAGPGSLARSVLGAGTRCGRALRYVAVEVSSPQRDRHPDGVESRATMPEGLIDGVVVANELLDNLPFRLAVHDGAWREAYVTSAPDGSFAEVLSTPFDPRPEVLPSRAAHGARAPLQDAAAEWVLAARSHVRRGRVLVIDYTRPQTAALAARDWRSWLRTYRGQAAGAHHLSDPGDQDVTVDVVVDQLPEPDVVRSQSQFLQLHGIGELVAEGQAAWTAGASRPDLATMRMRSRVSESEALLDPMGLGGFSVLEWSIAHTG